MSNSNAHFIASVLWQNWPCVGSFLMSSFQSQRQVYKFCYICIIRVKTKWSNWSCSTPQCSSSCSGRSAWLHTTLRSTSLQNAHKNKYSACKYTLTTCPIIQLIKLEIHLLLICQKTAWLQMQLWFQSHTVSRIGFVFWFEAENHILRRLSSQYSSENLSCHQTPISGRTLPWMSSFMHFSVISKKNPFTGQHLK